MYAINQVSHETVLMMYSGLESLKCLSSEFKEQITAESYNHISNHNKR